MSEKTQELSSAQLERLIHEIRGQKVMLDSDLARLYGMPTKRLNEQVKRNQARFPEDFMFQLTRQELASARNVESHETTLNRSQFATGSQKHRDSRVPPYAFTEHGAIMTANVLNNSQAVQMSVFVVRAFIKMRAALNDTRALAPKLAALEKELKDRLNVQEAAIVTILQRVMDIIDPPPMLEPPKRRMGFGVEEREAVYGRNGRNRRKGK